MHIGAGVKFDCMATSLTVWHVSVEYCMWQPQDVDKAVHCIQVVYQVQLENGAVVMVVLYLVYAEPTNAYCQTENRPQQRSQADMHDGYQWRLVTRSGSRFT